MMWVGAEKVIIHCTYIEQSHTSKLVSAGGWIVLGSLLANSIHFWSIIGSNWYFCNLTLISITGPRHLSVLNFIHNGLCCNAMESITFTLDQIRI